MKKTLLFLLFTMTLGALNAQNNVNIILNHYLGDASFELEKVSQNNLDNDFKLTRLQYYISGISIIHDNGLETTFDDVYALITTGAKSTSGIELGIQDITTAEKLIFHIGVEEAVNHLDPSTYPADHPLAPKNPSMHWGWAGGYRFIALEGKSSPDLNQDLQLHVIGDKNYVAVEIDLNETAVSGELALNINANYDNALTDIDISTGLIQHGDLGPNVTLVNNFSTLVFTDANAPVGVIESEMLSEFKLYPNPSNNGNLTLNISMELEDAVLNIYDVSGKLYQSQLVKSGNNTINIDQSGMYFATLVSQNGQILANEKLIIK